MLDDNEKRAIILEFLKWEYRENKNVLAKQLHGGEWITMVENNEEEMEDEINTFLFSQKPPEYQKDFDIPF